MFEQIILKISDDFDNGKRNLFYIITNKKNKREIYFQNTEKAISFIKKKFNSKKKRIIYSMIKLGILQPFLNKVYSSDRLGDVIFIANQIKCFDLNNKRVLSFPNFSYHLIPLFLIWKEFHVKIAKEGLAPEVFGFNKDYPYFEEELLEQYDGDYSIPLKLLKEYNKRTGLIHGDFVREHILKKNNSCVFIDWESRIGFFQEDLNNFKIRGKK